MKFIPAKKVAEFIRLDLKENHPESNFSVRTAPKGLIYVRWSGGPEEWVIKNQLDKFCGSHRNLLDQTESHGSVLTAPGGTKEVVRFGVDLICCERKEK